MINSLFRWRVMEPLRHLKLKEIMANTFNSERKKALLNWRLYDLRLWCITYSTSILNKDICFLTTSKLDFRVFVSPPANFLLLVFKVGKIKVGKFKVKKLNSDFFHRCKFFWPSYFLTLSPVALHNEGHCLPRRVDVCAGHIHVIRFPYET